MVFILLALFISICYSKKIEANLKEDTLNKYVRWDTDQYGVRILHAFDVCIPVVRDGFRSVIHQLNGNVITFNSYTDSSCQTKLKSQDLDASKYLVYSTSQLRSHSLYALYDPSNSCTKSAFAPIIYVYESGHCIAGTNNRWYVFESKNGKIIQHQYSDSSCTRYIGDANAECGYCMNNAQTLMCGQFNPSNPAGGNTPSDNTPSNPDTPEQPSNPDTPNNSNPTTCSNDAGDFGYMQVLEQQNAYLVGKIGRCLYVNEGYAQYFGGRYGELKVSKKGSSYEVCIYGQENECFPIDQFFQGSSQYSLIESSDKLPYHIAYAIIGCNGDEDSKPMILVDNDNMIPWYNGHATISVNGNRVHLTIKIGASTQDIEVDSGICLSNHDLRVFSGKFVEQKQDSGVSSIFLMIFLFVLLLL